MLLGAATLALAGAGWAGCTPLPVIQDARLVRGQDSGVAASVLVPTSASGDAVGPLVGASGWTRIRSLDRLETQLTFQVPAFALGAAAKLGIVGPGRGSPFALAVSADGASSLADGSVGYGVSGVATVRARRETDITLTARWGTAPMLSTSPVLATLMSVSFPWDGVSVHVGAGWVQNLGGDESSGPLAVIGYED